MGAEVDKGLGLLVLMTGVLRFVPVYERNKMGAARLTRTLSFFLFAVSLLVISFPFREDVFTNCALLISLALHT